jgi:hypothetical protein
MSAQVRVSPSEIAVDITILLRKMEIFRQSGGLTDMQNLRVVEFMDRFREVAREFRMYSDQPFCAAVAPSVPSAGVLSETSRPHPELLEPDYP